MKQYGLIGFPLSHSFSKKYFTEKFRKEQIQGCSYELYPIPTIQDLPALVSSTPDLKGINVTIPYKESVLSYLHESSPAVKEIGACNCIKIEDGQLFGFNTDVIGFEQMLAPHLRSNHKKALILGTGGAAKAVAWVFQKNEIKYQFVSRTRTSQVIGYEDLTEDLLQEYTIIVNTTPLGMQPNIHTYPSLNFNWLSANHLCIDLIYNPPRTVFLEKALETGAQIENGLQMLEIQAEESWKIWNING